MARILSTRTNAGDQNQVLDLILAERDFERIRQLLYGWCGISLNPSKKPLASNRLSKRLRALDLHSYDEYLAHVEQNKDEQEHFINALTTNLTSFFREAHHFDILADYLKNRPANLPINIWCSAASTGEEPYSIAMTAIEALGESGARRVRILASDLDSNVLQKGRKGVYSLERIEKLPKHYLPKYFLKGRGAHAGFAKIKPHVQALLTFSQINLLAPDWPVPKSVDVIFCRNVMIYFDKTTQMKILERFAPLLSPHGLLFAGHSESYSQAAHLFQLCAKTTYRRVGVEC